jgi:hypothetical protein
MSDIYQSEMTRGTILLDLAAGTLSKRHTIEMREMTC